MLVHVVMWTLKDNHMGMSRAQLAEEIKSKLLKLKDIIPQIQFIEVGINAHFAEKNHDIVLTTKFKNLEELQIYAQHPKHQEVVAFIKEVITGRAAVDYEM